MAYILEDSDDDEWGGVLHQVDEGQSSPELAPRTSAGVHAFVTDASAKVSLGDGLAPSAHTDVDVAGKKMPVALSPGAEMQLMLHLMSESGAAPRLARTESGQTVSCTRGKSLAAGLVYRQVVLNRPANRTP
jgi:hypothetical protein